VRRIYDVYHTSNGRPAVKSAHLPCIYFSKGHPKARWNEIGYCSLELVEYGQVQFGKIETEINRLCFLIELSCLGLQRPTYISMERHTCISFFQGVQPGSRMWPAYEVNTSEASEGFGFGHH
jgi:hypothetical protein